MKFGKYLSVLVMLGATFFTSSAIAKESLHNAYLSFGVGHTSVLDSEVDEPLAVKLEYRFAKRLKWGLIPSIGAGYSEGDASFIFASVEKEFYLSNRWILGTTFGFGRFDESEDLLLGSRFQFRSGVKLSYQLKNKYRLGLEIYHLSNAGISNINPGTEPVFLTVSIPF